MAQTRLTKTRLQAGRWQGVLTTDPPAEAPPPLEVRHLDRSLDDLRVEPAPGQAGRFLVSVPIPAELLSDGVQTFVICAAETGETLDSFTIIAGEALDDDIRAEIALLRAELDMMKKAFRRHCLETT